VTDRADKHGPREEPQGDKLTMNGHRKSDGPVVPMRSSNKGTPAREPAERAEGRGPTKGNSSQQNRSRTQRRQDLQQALERVREAAKRDEKLTAVWHHVYDVERLREAYLGMKRDAAAGADGETWETYGKNLETNLQALSGRLKRGAYRARPVRRVYIPKADGRQRALGVPALEDKIVQRATVEVLNSVYELDFKDFSYGFRPKRSQHDALNALAAGIAMKKVNWILDADIRGFFDAIQHDWIVKFLEHRIADERVVRHVKKWLHAGVLEDGEWRAVEEGTPQGGSVSPLLANIYLHYVLDLWFEQWRARCARGDVIIVRYADDFIIGFQHRDEAETFLQLLRERLERFGLELHPEKTRLIEFGRFAAEDRQKRGQGKPETFNFLGFTHACGRTKRGKFTVLRHTMRKRMQAKLRELGKQLKERMHWQVPEVGKWLASVLRGHYRYYGVPYNRDAMSAFRFHLTGLWYRTLKRRSQKHGVTWDRVSRLAKEWLPCPKIVHPYPSLPCASDLR
jgi:RNA-directed DNA polymerase